MLLLSALAFTGQHGQAMVATAFIAWPFMAFLQQRAFVMTPLVTDVPQAVDACNIASYLSAVDAALAALTSDRLRQLLMLKTSKK